ncbi:response regulator [Telmatospirillum sp.]|uniref:response regulator n=1 Tax=Telmatospirillum sp. TaxID=2079197 RepID=UPI00284FAC3B|nr:response regulator [Telmatospirillum sp.]MDR3438065.1 response regulator [Telmatospirillum sp.]
MSTHKSMLAGRRLLIADDESFSRFFVVRMVRDMGCPDVLQAADGAETLKHLGEAGDSLSALVLDFNMPQSNGLQVLKAIRTGKAGVPRNSNVLMLTGSSDFALVGAAMALDVDAFVIKPVSEAVMAERLNRMFCEAGEIKTVADYDAVDVETVSKRLLSNKPVTTTSAKSGVLMPKAAVRPAITTSSPTVRVSLEKLVPGAVLAENIRGPSGELLLGAATVLSERLLRRIKELQPALSIEHVTIFATGTTK